jgi:hypothetical protein
MNITLLITVIQIKHKLEVFDEWADQVDEFMDSEYIELEFEVEK